jgi:GNAT superfamily N-acetyltransferase
MADRWQIRQIEAADYEAVTTLLVELGRPAPTPATAAQVRAVFVRHVADSESASLLAEQQGEALGLLTLCFREQLNLAGPEAWIPDLYVREHARGSGVAVALFRRAVDLARARGCVRVALESGYQRQRAHRFYQREGLQDVGKHFRLPLEP